MAIPRRLIVIAASAAAAGVVLYVRNKMQARKDAERRERKATDSAGTAKPASSSPAGDGAAAGTSPPTSDAGSAANAGEPQSGSMKELSLFLAGESWYDEVGWQAIWEREGVGSPEAWLRSTGKDVLVAERKKLASHPALLAGCRRRWIVVCRYAGVDVGDAAALWNNTEA